MARRPKHIGDILPELVARRGYARVQAAATYDEAWQEAAGPLAAQYTRVGPLRRGTLEIIVANSTLVQELGFQKESLLKALAELLPNEGVRQLRFRVGVVQ